MPYTKIVVCGKTTEIYEYEKAPVERSSRRSHSSFRGNKSLARLIEPRRRDNLYRSRRNFVRLIKANLGSGAPPVLLTLTSFRSLGVGAVWAAFKQFCRRVERHTGSSLRYIAVIEFQKHSGNPHIHALIWGLSYGISKTERRSRFLQRCWQRGFVDCVVTDGSDALAGYLGKYLQKGMQDIRLSRKRAYSTSRDIMRPLLYSYHETLTDISPYLPDSVMINSTPFFKRHYQTDWLGNGTYTLYKRPS